MQTNGAANKPAIPDAVPDARFRIAIDVGADKRGSTALAIHANDVCAGEIVQHLIDLAAKIGAQGHDKRIMSMAEVRAQQHVAAIVRDYPAQAYHPTAQVFLCVACCDLYGHMLEGGAALLQPTTHGIGSVPCTFHLNPTLAPCTLEEAARQVPVLDSDVLIGDPDRAGADQE